MVILLPKVPWYIPKYHVAIEHKPSRNFIANHETYYMYLKELNSIINETVTVANDRLLHDDVETEFKM